GGLSVNTATGDWALDGWRIVLPSFGSGKFSIEGLTLGFSKGSQAGDWLLLVAGSVRPFGGTEVMVRLGPGPQAGVFIIESFGVQARGLVPGIPLGTSGINVSDLGLDVQNINRGNLSAGLLLGATFGRKITVAGQQYSLFQVSAEGTYRPGQLMA